MFVNNLYLYAIHKPDIIGQTQKDMNRFDWRNLNDANKTQSSLIG